MKIDMDNGLFKLLYIEKRSTDNETTRIYIILYLSE